MSQEDVYLFLKKNPKVWYSTKEIVDILKCSKNGLGRAANILSRIGFIEERWIQGKYRLQKEWKFKEEEK